MLFSKTTVIIALFATSAICAPLAQPEPATQDIDAPLETLALRDFDDAVFERAQTKGQLTQAYHQAEDQAKSALATAKSLDSSLKGKPHSAGDIAKMKASILTAYRAGHQAEKVRGDWMTLYGGSSLENVDLGHANAVQWIDQNIMQPTETLAKAWGVSL